MRLVSANRWVRTGAEKSEKIDTLHEFHGEKPRRTIRDQFVKRHQVRMDQFGQRAEFVLEAINGMRILLAKCFQSNAGLAFAVVDFKDDTHSAGADAAQEREPLM